MLLLNDVFEQLIPWSFELNVGMPSEDQFGGRPVMGNVIQHYLDRLRFDATCELMLILHVRQRM